MISVKNIPSNEKGGRAPGAPPLGSAHGSLLRHWAEFQHSVVYYATD